MKTKLVSITVLVFGLLGKTSAQIVAPKNMVLIKAGTFVMGSPETEKERNFDEMQHTVTLTRDFYMGKYEVTQGEYLAVMAKNPSLFQTRDQNGKTISSDLNRPVEGINWNDATNYCGKLTTLERTAGRLPEGWQYRLPTEAEWEYACRAGTSTAFHYGNELRDGMANFDGNGEYPPGPGESFYHYNPKGTYLPQTTPVGSYQPNAFGLYDMHGNVWEYCLDWYGEYPGGSAVDPIGPTTGPFHTFRGGSWGFLGWSCRSAARSLATRALGLRLLVIGFRPVLVSTGDKEVPKWKQAIEKPPIQPTYSTFPAKEDGKDSLVVVTHGWLPAWQSIDIGWVENMTNAISQYLVDKGLSKNWQIHAHKWVDKAHVTNPKNALLNAKKEGLNLGRSLVSQGFNHIHFITHSAGAGLIQSASETIKALRPNTIVHLTFLDPFVGFGFEETSNYGKGADWSDQYFSRDFETSGGIFPFTQSPLDHTYNVDVTWLDSTTKPIKVSYSTDILNITQTCDQIVSSHGWPHDFYLKTVTQSWPEAKGFGFPLSKEGGNWDSATSQYQVGNKVPQVLGSGEISCPPIQYSIAVPLNMESYQNFSKLPSTSVIINSQEHVIIQNLGFTLKTFSPAWLAAIVPITNRINLVSFEASFTSSSGAEGLLSVYSETNVIGSIDERITVPGTRQYTFPIPEIASSVTQTLGFRLDAFSAIQSSVIITNVALGFIGIREPFSLSFTGTNNNSLPVLQLTGPSGFNYRVESSTNLVDWSTIAMLVNTNGIVRFIDQSLTNNATTRFYRAVVP